MNKYQPALQWVIVSGEKRHVSDFAHLKPNQRPEAFCPLCEKTVIMRLGQKNVHHVAHTPDSICAATQPETALHINTKYYLQQELQKSSELYIWQFCEGIPQKIFHYPYLCNEENKRSVLFSKNWDRVEVEWQVGPYWLDVAMLNRDEVVGAIEVLVTHETEAEKKTYLNSLNIPWVEIGTSEEFYSGDDAWTTSKPLVAEDYNKTLIENWICKNCTDRIEEHHQRKREVKRHEKEQKRKREFAKQFTVLFARYVDYHYQSLKKYRYVYVIQTMTKNGEVVHAELQEINSKRRRIAIEYPPITEESISGLRQALKVELAKKEERGIILNRSGNWIKNPKSFHPKMFLDASIYPYAYENSNGKWEKIKIKKVPKPQKRHSRNYQFRSREEIELENKYTATTQKAELACVECGQYTSDWSVKYGGSKTCLCRECVVQKHQTQR